MNEFWIKLKAAKAHKNRFKSKPQSGLYEKKKKITQNSIIIIDD